MRIECLSVSKHLTSNRAGDDVPVVLPGRCFAVFDGATDVHGNEINGMGSGRFASTTAAAALLAHVSAHGASAYSPEDLVAAINARLRQDLDHWKVKLGRPIRAATTMALCEVMGDSYRFTLVGDSGIRINGTEVVQSLKPVDDITSTGRVLLYKLLDARGVAASELEPQSRRGVFLGFDAAIPDLISAEDASALIADARARLATQGFAEDVLAEVGPMLRAGIAGGQYRNANVVGHPLGYASMDGSQSQGFGFVSFTRPASDVRSVELFTDGYLDIPEGVSLAAWEEMFARIEAEDPGKTETYWGVKGSNAQQLFDDRTVIVVTGL